MKRSICALVLILGAGSLFGSYWTDPETGISWQYVTCEGGVSVGREDSTKTAIEKSTEGQLVIPAKINNLPVKQIGDRAFSQCENLTSISIPEGVAQIGERAFYYCKALKAIELPEGLTMIGEFAFQGCESLQELRIPKGVGDYSNGTWSSSRWLFGCYSLRVLEAPFIGACRGNYDQDGAATAILGSMFSYTSSSYEMLYIGDCIRVKQYYTSNYTYAYIPTNLVEVCVTDDTLVGLGAFSGCEMLQKISFSDKLEIVRDDAFRGCIGLKEIRFGAGVKTIGNRAFAECEEFDIYFTGDNPDVVSETIFGQGESSYSSSNGMIYVEYGTKGWNGDYTSIDLPTDGLWPSGGVVRRKIAYNPETYHPPVFSRGEGTFDGISVDIEISCDDREATIYYTLDGSVPSAETGKRYSKPITLYETKTIRAVSVKSGWLANPVATATFTKENALGPALNLLEVMPDNDKTHPWTVVTDVTHDGVSAVRSGAIGEDELTTLKAVVYGAGRLSFWWKTACEPSVDGEYYDYAAFFNGSTEIAKLAGVTDWQQVVLDVVGTGKHTFKWTYQKDDSGYEPPDCVWIDQVQWLPKTDDWYSDHTLTTETPVPYVWLDKYGLGRSSDFEAAAKAKSGKVDGAGRALTVEEEYVAGTDPTNMASRLETHIEVKDGAPVVTWTPDLNEGGTKALRTYKVWGKETLDSPEWEWPTNALHRFFTVTVEMP